MSSDKPPGGAPSQRPAKPPARPRLNATGMWLLVMLAMVLGFVWFQQRESSRDEITYSYFRAQLDEGNVSEVS